jgi:hypothetical protein
VFREFPSDKTLSIIEKSEWRKMIKDNEDLILIPYFNTVSQFIATKHKEEYLFRDFIYG